MEICGLQSPQVTVLVKLIDEALLTLEDLEIPDGDSLPGAVNKFLEALQNALKTAQLGTRVYPKELCFSTIEQCERACDRWNEQPDDNTDVASTSERQDNATSSLAPMNDPGGPSGEHDMEEDVEDDKDDEGITRKMFGVINNDFDKDFRAARTTLVLVASPPPMIFERTREFQKVQKLKPSHPRRVEAKNLHKTIGGDWHCFALKIQDGKICIYDPSYPQLNSLTLEPSKQRELKHFEYTMIIRQLIKRLYERSRNSKNPYKLEAVSIGGGGNEGQECRDMSCIQLLRETKHQIYAKRASILEAEGVQGQVQGANPCASRDGKELCAAEPPAWEGIALRIGSGL